MEICAHKIIWKRILWHCVCCDNMQEYMLPGRNGNKQIKTKLDLLMHQKLAFETHLKWIYDIGL